MKRLFWDPRQEDEEDEEEESFVLAPNLVSRSSARLQDLQQGLLFVAPQWQLLWGPQVQKACFKGAPVKGGVFLLPHCSIQTHYSALWRLLEQRSLLLFVHEYTRRIRLTSGFISRLRQLLQERTCSQITSVSFALEPSLVSLTEELRVHLSHWFCLFTRVHSDRCLRHALVSHTKMLEEMKQTLETLSLQMLVLMEQYVCAVVSAVGLTSSRDAVEELLAGLDLYNQLAEEQRLQMDTPRLRNTVLQLARLPNCFRSPKIKTYKPFKVSVKKLMDILVVHHANIVAKQLYTWTSEQICVLCYCCSCHKPSSSCSSDPACSCGEPTYQLSSAHFNKQSSGDSCSFHTCSRSTSLYNSNQLDCHGLENDLPALTPPSSFKHSEENLKKHWLSQSRRCMCRSAVSKTFLQKVRPKIHSNGSETQQRFPLSSDSPHLPSARLPVDLLLQVLMSFTDLLSPLVCSETKESAEPPVASAEKPVSNLKTDVDMLRTAVPNTTNVDKLQETSSKCTNGQNVDITQDDSKLDLMNPDITKSSGGLMTGSTEDKPELGSAEVEPGPACAPHSVQWLDLKKSLLHAHLLQHYHCLLWSFCSKALWLKLNVVHPVGSIHFQVDHKYLKVLCSVARASEMDLPKEYKAVLEHLSYCLWIQTVQAGWDSGMCKSLGLAQRDKCLKSEERGSVAALSNEGHVVMSQTFENFLQLQAPLLSSLGSLQSNDWAEGIFRSPVSRCVLERRMISLMLATVQSSSVWVMAKAQQFLSAWSPNRFMLITQGDLRMLLDLFEHIGPHAKLLLMNSRPHLHDQHLLRQQLKSLQEAESHLKSFSAVVLKTFSMDCKLMSVEIIGRTMPPAGQWRASQKTAFPSSPSSYASMATQTVIGPVLEAVAPLSEDVQIKALSLAVTAFLEAWMEHILRQKIRFSVYGALQLKQDLDSVRQIIKHDKYGMSPELHQRILSLRVFQQVDSAVICLLQQPLAKPYLQRAWRPFTSCCPLHRGRDSMDSVAGSNITNLGCVEGEELSQAERSAVSPGLLPLDASSPAEPYLVPSAALAAAQQEWLDLRIQNRSRPWRLPGLKRLSKMEH